MADQNTLPLYEKIRHGNAVNRAFDIIVFLLLVLLLGHRLHLINSHGFSWVQATAFLCELFFAFNSLLILNIQWSPVDYIMYPDRLLDRVSELPPVDMFVTTADSELEPPIITINTVISLLAVDYPADKMACYVSDDGCSPLTFFSLREAAKFARLWVPFCKKYNIPVRAPFRYFSMDFDIPPDASRELQEERKRMKVNQQKKDKL